MSEAVVKLPRAAGRMEEALTPSEIVTELDKYIIGQKDAKRAVAIALRNRWRRRQLRGPLRDEVAPKNILMIGPTGVGKTEIARRLAKLADAPFLKVEATKYTEVGYVGRDVESMVRDLTEMTVKSLMEREIAAMKEKSIKIAEERVLDLLLPPKPKSKKETDVGVSSDFLSSPPKRRGGDDPEETQESYEASREKMRRLLNEGKLDERVVDVEATDRALPIVELFTPGGMEEVDLNLKDVFGNILTRKSRRRKLKVAEALEAFRTEEAQRMVDHEKVSKEAIRRVEESGILFVDELDKIAGRDTGHGPDVSREGVQRDLLPIVEGSTVSTKYGMVRTDHILFIAAGAFHATKPSDLIPELQGRFPIRVELSSLGKEDFERILVEPENALVKQYVALMETEGVRLNFRNDAVEQIASIAQQVNEGTENIGARRLHTILEKVLEHISFEGPSLSGTSVEITSDYVLERVQKILKDKDLSRYIL